MKILFLYQNEIALKLADVLRENKNEVVLWKDELDIDKLLEIRPEKIISYSYRYLIKKEVIDFMPTAILNLHISYLPWNRGANPNFWSFMDNTIKGVTIHEIDDKLDKGIILLQKELKFDEEKETFFTTYQKLNEEIVNLFQENMEDLLGERLQGKVASEQGSYHSVVDFEKYTENCNVDWNMIIAEYKRKFGR